MKCAICNSPDHAVVKTPRVPDDWPIIRRRRECKACGHRWWTMERAATDFAEDIALAEGVRKLVREGSDNAA